MAAALLLPLLESGCFLFNRAHPQPPTLTISQPVILSTEPVLPPPPLPPVVAASKPPASSGADAEPAETAPARRVRRPVRRVDHPKEPPAPPPAPADQPQLTTKLSPAEAEAYRRSAAEWLDAAQHDLQLIAGRTLPGAQEATRLQASEYIHQAQQALNQGDLVRAQGLAHKALVLAEAVLESS